MWFGGVSQLYKQPQSVIFQAQPPDFCPGWRIGSNTAFWFAAA
jgi:hypothetical protein